MTSTFEVGSRVVVSIKDLGTFAVGAAEALNGKTGVIEEISTRVSDAPNFLVRFDTPAEPWFTYQSPAKAFWFNAGDLKDAS